MGGWAVWRRQGAAPAHALAGECPPPSTPHPPTLHPPLTTLPPHLPFHPPPSQFANYSLPIKSKLSAATDNGQYEVVRRRRTRQGKQLVHRCGEGACARAGAAGGSTAARRRGGRSAHHYLGTALDNLREEVHTHTLTLSHTLSLHSPTSHTHTLRPSGWRPAWTRTSERAAASMGRRKRRRHSSPQRPRRPAAAFLRSTVPSEVWGGGGGQGGDGG